MKDQRGQSMVEFAVGASVLSLLMLGTVSLAGYSEIQRRTLLAARQNAFQAMWHAGRVEPDPAQLHAADFTDAGAADPVSGRAYVGQRDLAVTTSRIATDGAAARAAQLLLTPLRLPGGFSGTGFDLQEGGFLRAQVTARLAPLTSHGAPFNTLDLSLVESFTVLADPWHASGPAHVVARSSGLVPGSRLAALNGLWSALLAPVRLLDPTIGQLCLGVVEPERLPEDRLGRGVTPLLGSCP